jgi:D-threo-aldose 1-dehydrogenase
VSIDGNIHRPFGATGILVPPIAFRANVLDDALRILPEQTKRLISGEWMRRIKPPVFIDVALHEKRNSPLSTLGRLLSQHDVAPDEVVLNLELEAPVDSRDSAEPDPLCKQFDDACELLGKNHIPRIATLRLKIENERPNARTLPTSVPAVDWLRELKSLKTRHKLAAIGIALLDWRLSQKLRDVAHVDFIKLLNGPTVLRHPPEMLEWLAALAAEQIAVITAGVFHGGFLVGGPTFDDHQLNADSPAGQSLIAWRKAFTALCHGHGVRPAQASIQFALSIPGVVAVSLRTSSVDRVSEDVYAATTPVLGGLWTSMKEEGLLAHDHGDAPT